MTRERRKVATLHAPLGKAIAEELLEVINITCRDVMKASAVWVTTSTNGTPDLVIMAEVEVPDPPPRRRRSA